MKLLYFSPRAFGLMGTPGTYQLTEAFHVHVDILVVANSDQNNHYDIVHPVDKKLKIKNISMSRKDYLDVVGDIVSSFQPDIVCIANFARWFEVAQCIKNIDHNIKIILDIKSPLITEETTFNTLNKVQLQSQANSHLLDLVISRCMEDIESWIPNQTLNTFIYPLGLDTKLFTSYAKNIDMHHLKMVFIGSYSANRKLPKLLGMIAQLPKKIKNRISLDMFGSGPEEDFLKSFIKEQDLMKNVTIYPALPQKELFKKLSDYDVGLGWVPSEIYNAAPSLKSLEYIAAGLIPLLSATKGHIREVTTGFNALFFDENASSLQIAIEKIFAGSFTSHMIKENLHLIEQRDWDFIVTKKLLPQFHKLLLTTNLHPTDSNENKVQYESHWHYPCHVFQSTLKNDTGIKALCLTSDRLYYGMRDELDYIPLSEGQWQNQLQDNTLDFILLETCFESYAGNWHYAMIGNVSKNLEMFITHAQKKKIPIVLWCTLDFEYAQLFKDICSLVDFVGYADSKYKDYLNQFNIISFELLPAIQPRIYNPLKVPSEYASNSDFEILIQSVKGIEQKTTLVETIIKNKDITFIGFERTYTPTRNHLRRQNQLADNFISKGKLSYRILPEVLKRSSHLILSSLDDTTQTELAWQFLENTACRCLSFFPKVKAPHPIFNEFSTFYEIFSKTFVTDAINLSKKEIESEALKTILFRHVMNGFVFSKRLETILDNIQHTVRPVYKVPKVSVVTPTKRLDNLAHIIKNFTKQTYKNKELIIVINESELDNNTVQKSIDNKLDIQIISLPSEKNASSLLNYAAKICNGKYLFRFDDDDYYGDEYLSDMVRLFSIDDASLVGKFASYVKIEEENSIYKRKNTSTNKQLLSFSAKDLPLPTCAISGATFGIKVELLRAFPFIEDSLQTADSAWLETIRKNAPFTRCIKGDMFQFTIGRRIASNDHTWQNEKNDLVDISQKISQKITEVPR